MQDNPTASSHVLETLRSLATPIALIVGVVLGQFVKLLKVKPEVSILQASAEKTRAEARKLDGETINLAWERIDELTEINSELRKQLDLCEIRGRHHENQEAKMLALLKLHGVKYSEFDEPKQ
jgi:hypothetical protein